MTAAARATARRWIAFAAASAIVAHAFGMGVLGPRMAGGIAPVLASAPVIEMAAAGDGSQSEHLRHGGAAADLAVAHSDHPGVEPDPAGDEPSHKHQRPCEACPLGQGGMALAPPVSFPAAPMEAEIASAKTRDTALVLRLERHRMPPARAPPLKA